MAKIIMNRAVLNEILGKTVSDAEWQEIVPMMGTVLERCEPTEIEVEIFANRPDMLSEHGFARSFARFSGMITAVPSYSVKSSSYVVTIESPVKKIRPLTVCGVVKGIQFTEQRIKELMQLQEKLHGTLGRQRKKCSIGVYPMEHIAWPIIYTAKKPTEILFKPLGATKQMDAKTMVTEHPTAKAYAHLLDDCSMYPVFIDGKHHVLSVPPLINSEETGRVTEETTDVFVECSGSDQTTLAKALNILCCTLSDMGGTIYSVSVMDGKETRVAPCLAPEEMKLSLSYATQRLGILVTDALAKKCLQKMCVGWKNGTAFVPAYRADVIHPIDIVEDIAIGYGYSRFVPALPNVATTGKEDSLQAFVSKVRDQLIALGGEEVINYHLGSEELYTTKVGYLGDLVTVESSNQESGACRPALLPGLLHTLSTNMHNEFPQNIFELGEVFTPATGTAKSSETKVIETMHLGIALCHAKATLTEARQWLETLIGRLGLGETVVTEHEFPSFVSGRSGTLSVKGTVIGKFGEVHPQILTHFGITMPVAILEMDVEMLKKLVDAQ